LVVPLPFIPPGQNKDEMVKSPFVERLLKKDYEVIYFTDVLDEYVMGHMLEFDDKKFADATKEDLKMSDKDEKEKKRDKVGLGRVRKGL
jgi:heat shock protein beta